MPVQFPAVIELSSLNGRNGFQLNGIANDNGRFDVFDINGCSVLPVISMMIGSRI